MYEIACYWTKLLPIGIDGENRISCSVSLSLRLGYGMPILHEDSPNGKV